MQQSAGGKLSFLGYAVPRHFDQMVRQRRTRNLFVDRRAAGRVITFPGAVECARQHQTQFGIGRINHLRTNEKPPGNGPDGIFNRSTGCVAASISSQ